METGVKVTGNIRHADPRHVRSRCPVDKEESELCKAVNGAFPDRVEFRRFGWSGGDTHSMRVASRLPICATSSVRTRFHPPGTSLSPIATVAISRSTRCATGGLQADHWGRHSGNSISDCEEEGPWSWGPEPPHRRTLPLVLAGR